MTDKNKQLAEILTKEEIETIYFGLVAGWLKLSDEVTRNPNHENDKKLFHDVDIIINDFAALYRDTKGE